MQYNSSKNALLSIMIGFIAFLAAAHLLIRSSQHGLFIGVDTVLYLSTAENLAAGEGLRDYEYGYPVWWPPFYPLLLALINPFGVEVWTASRVLNIVTLGLVILLIGHWLNRHIRSRLLIAGAVAIVAASHIINIVALFALSDMLFISLTLVALIQVDKFLNQETPMKALLLSALFAVLASLTRYIGVAVMFTTALLIILDWKLPIRKKLRYTIIYGTAAFLPYSIYIVSHQIITGTITGRYRGSQFIPFDQLKSIIDMIYVWFFVPEPGNIHALSTIVNWWLLGQGISFRPPIWVIFYIWIIVSMIVLVTFISIFKPDQDSVWDSTSIKTLLLLVTYNIIYLFILLLPLRGAPIIAYRYLAPIMIPTLACIVLMSERFLRKETWSQATILAIVLKLTLVALLALGCVLHINRISQWNIGITAQTLEYANYTPYLQGYTPNSPIIEYLNDNSLNGNILTTNLPILYRLTDIPPPVRQIGCSHWVNQPTNSTREKPGHTYIVLLTKVPNYSTYCDFEDMVLDQYSHPELIVEKSDGVIYKVNPSLIRAIA